jgi:hypothetical protein
LNGTGAVSAPFQTVQFAVNQSCDGDSVVIAPGFYQENVSILNKDLRFGGFEVFDSTLYETNAVILDGGDVATTLYIENSAVHVSGLTVQNGRSPYGAGIYLNNCSNSILERCVSRDNTGTGDITAHGINIQGNNVVVRACEVYGNYGRKHVVNLGGSNILFDRCYVHDNNTWEEGTVVVYSSSTKIQNCLIRNNNGGGITTYRNDTEVVSSTIVDNQGHGLFTWSYSNPAALKIWNSIVYGNGNVPSDNLKMTQTGATTSRMDFKHCILENLDNYSWLSVYKIIEMDSTVTDVDPQLDATGALTPTSPAIGAGAGLVVWPSGFSSAPLLDFAGATRPNPAGSQPDLGCFEHPLGLPTPVAGCTDPQACNYNPSVTEDDGSCIQPSCALPIACNYAPEGVCFADVCVFPGCTDPAACNYDSAAGCDDASCLYAGTGCIDPVACNFDSSAVCDDGSCDYSCCPGPGCCSAGMVWEVSIQRCVQGCQADLNGDGGVNIGDLLILLVKYETPCD